MDFFLNRGFMRYHKCSKHFGSPTLPYISKGSTGTNGLPAAMVNSCCPIVTTQKTLGVKVTFYSSSIPHTLSVTSCKVRLKLLFYMSGRVFHKQTLGVSIGHVYYSPVQSWASMLWTPDILKTWHNQALTSRPTVEGNRKITNHLWINLKNTNYASLCVFVIIIFIIGLYFLLDQSWHVQTFKVFQPKTVSRFTYKVGNI